jgi:hypothetical protein
MKIIINNEKASSIFFDNIYYDTKKIIDVPFSIAIRLSKLFDITFHTDPVPYDAELFSKEKKFAFTSDIDQVSGWGNVSFNLLKSSLDYKIALTGRLFNINDGNIIKMSKDALMPSECMVWHEQPKASWPNSPFAKNIAIIPFETTGIPKSWISKINKFDALFVPCKQNIEAFKSSGVTVPIELVHWGIDTDKFKVIERPIRETFTFGTMGALSIRKGTDVLVQAFQEQFPKHLYPNVRLICKTSNPYYPFMVKDDRIKVMLMPISHEELMETFFKEIDCFVFPTRGEGFGLTPLEALSTGVPAIVTGWSGPEEYMTDEIGWTIKYSLTPAKDFTDHVYKEECGDWAEPDLQHLKELMLYAYEHQDEVKEKGKSAAKYINDNWQWKDKIKMFHDALEQHL